MTDRDVLDEFLDAYNEGRFDDLRTHVATGYIHHNGALALTADQFCAGAAWIRRGAPDFRITVLDRIAQSDQVAARFEDTGTHTGSFGGEAPSGKMFTLYGTTIYRIEGGKIAEDWEALDEQPLRDLLAGA